MASSKKIVALICISLVTLFAVGCSDDSNPVSTPTPVDTAPPAVPANLDVNLSNGTAVVNWAANTTDSDLAGYIVTRDSYGNVETLVGDPTLITSYADEAPLMGTTTYNVYAVDEAGNESAVASVELIITGDHQTRDLDH
jgi:fibronectin type 3 domain-containing protein